MQLANTNDRLFLNEVGGKQQSDTILCSQDHSQPQLEVVWLVDTYIPKYILTGPSDVAAVNVGPPRDAYDHDSASSSE